MPVGVKAAALLGSMRKELIVRYRPSLANVFEAFLDRLRRTREREEFDAFRATRPAPEPGSVNT